MRAVSSHSVSWTEPSLPVGSPAARAAASPAEREAEFRVFLAAWSARARTPRTWYFVDSTVWSGEFGPVTAPAARTAMALHHEACRT